MNDHNRFLVSVVMPVYNTEKYLAESLDSVIRQTLGFEHIQIILVNDGSTDGSETICLDYAEKYPDNIVYAAKENSGVSAARNKGIEYIEGKYVNFLDSDDCWEEDAFEKLTAFFDENYDRTDVVCARKKFFGAKTGYHHLDYKFDKSRMADLRKEPECIQLDVTGAFIKADAIGQRRFSEHLKYGEDAQFVNSILLDRCTLGICREAVHLYRKRLDESAALQNEQKSLSYYFDSPKYFHQALLVLSKKKYGKIEPFIQYTVMYDLAWRVQKKGIRNYLDEEQYRRYCDIITDLLKQISDTVILKQRKIGKRHKLYCLLKKHGLNAAAEAVCSLGQ